MKGPSRRPALPGLEKLIGIGLVAAAAIAAALAVAVGPSPRANPIKLLGSRGALSSSNSLQGSAILAASDMAPGDSTSGQVRIDNNGARGDLVLEQRQAARQTGLGVGRLFKQLQLEVTRIGHGTAAPVYRGDLAAADGVYAGSPRAGGTETHRFRVTLPDSGLSGSALATDNRFQGASTRITYRWSLIPFGRLATRSRCLIGRSESDAPETVFGTGRGDRVLARGGGDTVFGGGGPDCLLGGRGADSLDGGTGGDELRGGLGNDTLQGGAGGDTIRGSQGDDLIVGGPGGDELRGTIGDDLTRARGGGADRVRCGIGHDVAVVDGADAVHGCETVRRAGG